MSYQMSYEYHHCLLHTDFQAIYVRIYEEDQACMSGQLSRVYIPVYHGWAIPGAEQLHAQEGEAVQVQFGVEKRLCLMW